MSRRIRKLFTLALPVAAIAAGAAWMLGLGQASRGAISYDTAEATRGAIRRIVSTSGPVRAVITVSVGSQLSGQIQEIAADFNSEVKPGQVLARLDAKTFEARVAQARADLAAAEAAVRNQEAALAKAEAVLRQTGRAIERQRALADRRIASQSTLDTAIRDEEVAKAELSVARAQIESAKATVAQRRAQLAQAQIDLDRTEIRSPIDGTVISRTVDRGQTVAASLQAPELFKIAQDLRQIQIEAQVNEADIGAVAEGNAVAFTVDAYPERRFEGKVAQVRLAATELQNVVTYTVIVEAANEDRRLFPGMTANVEIETDTRENVLRVPNDALRFRPREDGAAGDASRSTGGSGEGRSRTVDQLKDALELTAEQEKALRDAVRAVFAERRAAGQSGGPGSSPADPAQTRQRVEARIAATIEPLLTDAQRPLYERWRKDRNATRSGAVWVLGKAGTPERRSVRLGIADDQFTEVAGGELAAGDRIVLKAREAGR
jgi:HlyD family secretion protein